MRFFGAIYKKMYPMVDMDTPTLLTAYEHCDRKGVWSRDWKEGRLRSNEMLIEAIRAGVIEKEREDFGVVAGERVMELAEDPGLENPANHQIYDSVIHHATLADILVSAIRRPQGDSWVLPPAATLGGAPWASGAYFDPSGKSLRRVALVSAWNDERHYSEMRSWYSLGEVAAYEMPLTVIVLVLGQLRDGKRHTPFAKGFLHPVNRLLRFRKKGRSSSEVFSDRWKPAWREEHDEIETRQWLQSMLADDILRDVCFTVELPVPGKAQLMRIREMAAKKLDRLDKLGKLPEASMSVCDRPPCSFRGCCWSEEPYLPSSKTGFVQIKKMPSR